jgi:hypothetical protein
LLPTELRGLFDLKLIFLFFYYYLLPTELKGLFVQADIDRSGVVDKR